MNLTVKIFGILRLLLTNKVAVYLILSKTLYCEKLKCRLIIPLITDKMVFDNFVGMCFIAQILHVCVIKAKYAQLTQNADHKLSLLQMYKMASRPI